EDRQYDYGFLRECAKPKLFVSGSRDQFGPKAQLTQVLQAAAEPKKLVWIDAADHFFEGRLREMREAIETWISEQLLRSRSENLPSPALEPPLRWQYGIYCIAHMAGGL